MNILEMSFFASLLIIVTLVIRFLALYHFSKSTFLFLWFAVLVKLLVPISIQSEMSIFNLFQASYLPQNFDYQLEQSQFLELYPELYQVINLPQAASFIPQMLLEEFSNENQITPILLQSEETSLTNNILYLVNPLILVWLAVAVIMLLFFTKIYLSSLKDFAQALPLETFSCSKWLAENKIKRNIRIKTSDKVLGPLTYGIFRPVIILPKNIDESALQFVLNHELVHIKRFDSLIKLLATLSLCLHWFNPFVWVMYFMLNRDIELSCDEIVIKNLNTHFGSSSKKDYCLTLLSFANIKELTHVEKLKVSPLINTFNNNIEERIGVLMKSKKTNLLRNVFAVATVATAVTIFATRGVQLNAVEINVQNGEQQYFESITNKLFYRAFGAGYGLALRNAAPLNLIYTADQITIEVLYTVSLTSEFSFYNFLWLEDGQIDETYTPEKVTIENLRKFNIFSLSDNSGDLNFFNEYGEFTPQFLRSDGSLSLVHLLHEEDGVLYLLEHQWHIEIEGQEPRDSTRTLDIATINVGFIEMRELPVERYASFRMITPITEEVSTIISAIEDEVEISKVIDVRTGETFEVMSMNSFLQSMVFEHTINLNIDFEFESPIANVSPLYFNDIAVEISNESFNLSNIVLTSSEFSFTIENGAELAMVVDELALPLDLQIILEYENYSQIIYSNTPQFISLMPGVQFGRITPTATGSSFYSHPISRHESNLQFRTSPGIIDLENLQAIIINSVRIELSN